VLAHPVEEAFGNMLPLWAGPILIADKHIVTCCIWLFFSIIHTVSAHSGYDLPIINSERLNHWIFGGSQMHDFHHRKIDGNYGGATNFWDRLMGTYMED